MKKCRMVLAAAVGCAFGAVAGASPLAQQAMEPLPLGAIRPEGWLGFQLGRMTEGLVGRHDRAQPRVHEMVSRGGADAGGVDKADRIRYHIQQ